MLGDRIEAMIHRIPRLPRKWRVVRNLVCSVLLVVFIWYAMGTPALTQIGAFRRAEKANLFGPSEIVHRVEMDGVTYFYGELEDGFAVAGMRSRFFTDCDIRYWKKTEAATFIPVGFVLRFDDYEYQPMLLFCEMEQAVRGELDITIISDGIFNDKPYDFNETYTIEFEPEKAGVFTGNLYPKTPDDGSWESELERIMLAEIYYDTEDPRPIEARLYDENDQLIYREALQFQYEDWY